MQAAAKQGLTDTLRAAIADHRDSWITESDFQLMAGAGINAVRVPLGYWVLATSQVNGVLPFVFSSHVSCAPMTRY